MATSRMQAYLNPTKHAVGSLVSMDKYIQDIPNGAIATADVDNFAMVSLGFNTQGERTFTPLVANTAKSYIVVAKEVRFFNEALVEFYVATGERSRIIIPTEGLQIGVSAYTLNAGITTITAGQKAHWDVATKTYLIHDGTHTGFANANVKFTVITSESDLDYTLGVPMVTLEVDGK